MAGTKSTEAYWGRTIELVTERQADGRWRAAATVQTAGAEQVAHAFEVRDRATEQEATSAARGLAAGSIDAQRVTEGKP